MNNLYNDLLGSGNICIRFYFDLFPKRSSGYPFGFLVRINQFQVYPELG